MRDYIIPVLVLEVFPTFVREYKITGFRNIEYRHVTTDTICRIVVSEEEYQEGLKEYNKTHEAGLPNEDDNEPSPHYGDLD